MDGFLTFGGGYRKLRVYKLAEIAYDLSVIFAETYIRPGSRTRDQMEQAARSGKQNIAEGSKASTTSRETEIKLTNVALASLEELLLDYEDYLRQHHLQQWDKNNPRVLKLRDYLKTGSFLNNPTKFLNRMSAEEFCNMCVTLINQTTYMLRKLLIAQEQQFLKYGGCREQMYRARTKYRSQQTSQESVKSDGSDTSDTSDKSDKSDKSDNPDPHLF